QSALHYIYRRGIAHYRVRGALKHMGPWSHFEAGPAAIGFFNLFPIALANVSIQAACNVASVAPGREMVKRAPPSSQFSPAGVPPWASTMLRAIASPMPVSSALVVKKGLE